MIRPRQRGTVSVPTRLRLQRRAGSDAARQATVRSAALLSSMLLLIWTLPGEASLLERTWREFRSDHFRVVTDLAPDSAREHIHELERFRLVASAVTGIDSAAGAPTHAIIFARQRDFADLFGPQHAGFADVRLGTPYLVAGGGTRRLDQRTILFHEYVHYLLRQGSIYYPEWFHEGMAELLSTVQERDGDLIIGLPPPRVARDTELTFSVAAVIHASSSGLHPRLVHEYYLGAWALVHYLVLGAGPAGTDRRLQLAAYLDLRDQGLDSEHAFAEAFDVGEQALSREVTRHHAGGRTPQMTLRASDFEVEVTIRSRPLDETEIAVELGMLLVTSQPLRARELFSQALERSPEDASIMAGLAASHRHAGEFALGVRKARLAVGIAADDPLALTQLGNVLLAWCRSDERPAHCQVLIAEAESHYEAVLSVAPDAVEARYGLAVAWLARQRNVGEAYETLRALAAQRPWHAALVFETGLAALSAGDIEQGLAYLARARAYTQNETLQAHVEAVLARVSELLR
jgi:tetratricopeptide (TPR) repeat protein